MIAETGAGFWTADGLARLRATTAPSQPQNIVSQDLDNHGAYPLAFYHTNRQPEFGNYEDVSPAVKVGSGSGGNPPAVAFKPSHYTRGKDGAPSEVMPPLSADTDKGDQEAVVAFNPKQGGRSNPVTPESPTLEAGTGNKTPATFYGTIPRRLTPTECERLQGFPGGWTEVEHNGKPMADGPIYRMMGNAVTVNVASWLAQRIKKAHEEVYPMRGDETA